MSGLGLSLQSWLMIMARLGFGPGFGGPGNDRETGMTLHLSKTHNSNILTCTEQQYQLLFQRR